MNAELDREDSRPVIQVACGVLQQSSGEVLIAQRPPGKLAAGKWEFPGGKIEPGESVREALVRELREELGVQVLDAAPLIRLRQDYSDRRVWLDTWRVTGFENEPASCEGQQLAWIRAESIGEFDVLPSCWRVAAALRLPRDYVFTRPDQDADSVIAGIARLPRSALLRLRLPSLDDNAYSSLAVRAIEAARDHAIGVILDRDPAQADQLGAAGWHGNSAQLQALSQRPLSRSRMFIASTHGSDEINRAHALDADAVVLGPVLATSTHPDVLPLGWPEFAALSREAGLPVYALGGVGPAQHEIAGRHGAFGIAGISAYWS